jgi:4-hydroxy-tetrahydrodipicolinate reductase
MTTKIIVNGARGRMGQEAVRTIRASKGFELVAELGREDDLAASIQQTQADVVVDLTTASAAYDNAVTIIENHARPVIGTSGLLPNDVQDLRERCQAQSLGGIVAPNFSIGAALMMRFSEQAAKYFNYAEIIELHHERKKDAPSGTGIATAELIGSVRANHSHECTTLLEGALGATHKTVPLHSVRMPGLLAHQEVIFGDHGGTLKIRHDSMSREDFMPGLLMCCQKVLTLDHLVYGLEKLL